MLAWDTSVWPEAALVDDDEFEGPDFEEDEEFEDGDEDLEEDDFEEDDEYDPYEEYEELGDEVGRRHHPRREEWDG